MYISRKIQPEIRNHLARKEFTIITGARQCGKTSLLIALFNELKEQGHQVSYLTLEDTEILRAINEHPENIFSFAPRPGKTSLDRVPSGNFIYLFIDEIQYAKQPSNLLKYLYDKYRENLKILATGSSAFYLDAKFTDSLAVRKRIFVLRTQDFEEMLRFHGHQDSLLELERVRNSTDYFSSQRHELMDLFNEYLVYGGYPEVVLEQDKNEKIKLLKEIRDSFLKIDMDESGISNPEKFYQLVQILAGQTGNLLNTNELSKHIGLDHKTVGRYLFILQKCFHIDLLKPFHSNSGKELRKMPKVYFHDSGLRNMALNRFFNFIHREDKGTLVENYLFTRLRDIYGTDSLRFWRTADKHEIDFVIAREPDTGEALEVKMQCTAVKSSTRQRFLQQYPGFTLKIISYHINKDCTWLLKI